MFRRFAFFLAVMGLVCAQEERASIAGLITDPGGSGVPNAQITIKNVERNTSSQAISSDAGTEHRIELSAQFLDHGTEYGRIQPLHRQFRVVLQRIQHGILHAES